MGEFVIITIGVLVFCLAVSMMIFSFISDDDEHSALQQIWHTFFGGSGDDK